MKNPKLKIPNLKKPKIGKWVPYIFIGVFLLMGALILGFGYFSFKRPAEDSIISKAKSELQEINIDFNREKVLNLFNAEYSTSNIKEPSFPTKNPFLAL